MIDNLSDLCIESITQNNVPYEGKSPIELKQRIDQKYISSICGQTVTRLRLIEENREQDIFLGHIEGIQGVIQNKHHYCCNLMFCEKYSKKGVYNVGYINCALVLFYFQQEAGFNDWYRSELNRNRGYRAKYGG